MISRSSLGNAYPIKKLGEVVEFLDSIRRPVTESERKSGPYPYYGANGQQGSIDSFLFDEPLVLLAEDGGHFENPDRGIAYRVFGKTWVNNHAHVLRPIPSLDFNYLCRVLENYDVTPFVTGTTRGKLTKGGASEIPIPLPPLPEQRRIAAILDQADALRAKRREALAELDQLTQSIFIEMFGGDTPTKQLGDIASLKRGPFGGALKKEIFVSHGPMVYEQRNAIQDDCLTGRYFITEAKYHEMEDFSVKPDDLVISCSGTIGKVAIVPDNAPRGIINQALLRVRVDRSLIAPIYLKKALESQAIQNELSGLSHGTGLQNFPPMSDVRALSIPVPTMKCQVDFQKRLETIASHKGLAEESVTELDSLFSSLQHRAFRGEL